MKNHKHLHGKDLNNTKGYCSADDNFKAFLYVDNELNKTLFNKRDYLNKQSNISSNGYVITEKIEIPIDSNTEHEFNELATKWKQETGLYSTFVQKVNDTYLEIIFDGKRFLPYILKDLQKGGSVYWHIALKIITKFNPFPDNNLGNSKEVKAAWIAWGKKNNII